MHASTLLAAASILIAPVLANLEVVNPTKDCVAYYKHGYMEFCGEGVTDKCRYNGTVVSNCLINDDDDIGQPFCPSNRAFLYPSGRNYNPERDTSDQCDTDYHGNPEYWVGTDYRFRCCACPKGFIPAGGYPSIHGIARYNYNITMTGGPYERTCMRCSGSGEKLTYNKQTGEFYCSGGTSTTTSTTTTMSTKTTQTPTPVPTPGGPGGQCRASSNGLTFIKSSVGMHANAYTFNENQEIGYAHFCLLWRDCYPGGAAAAPLSQATAESLLLRDVGTSQACISNLAGSSGLNQNQFDALVAFVQGEYCYQAQDNFGPLVGSGQYDQICEKLKTANNPDNDAAVAALRKKQSDLCKTPTTVKSGCKK